MSLLANFLQKIVTFCENLSNIDNSTLLLMDFFALILMISKWFLRDFCFDFDDSKIFFMALKSANFFAKIILPVFFFSVLTQFSKTCSLTYLHKKSEKLNGLIIRCLCITADFMTNS